MIASLGEVEALARKAARGAGWTHGLAVEAGRAAAWLCASGADGAAAALRALDASPEAPRAERTAGGWRFPRQPAIAAGPSVFELLEAAPGDGARIEGCDCPAMLAGYAGAAAGRFGARYVISSGAFRVELGAAGAAGAGEGSGAPADLPAGETLLVERAPAPAPAPPRRPAPAGVPVAEADWAGLERLAAGCLVPASEASRLAGAGAGLTDND